MADDDENPPPDLVLPGPPPRPGRLRQTIRRVDTDPRALGVARWVRGRLPGDDQFGDPLSVAGDTPPEVIGRRVSALHGDRPSALHELGLGGLQLWQSLSEAAGRGRGDRPVALLFTDLVGFSNWALKAGDEATLELLRAVGAVVEPAVLERRGVVVKRLGDGLMAAFSHPADAVDAALDAGAGVREIEVAGHTPKMRSGVHYGQPRKIGGDYLGVDVNIAARVGEAAKPNQVLVSEPAYVLLDHDRLKGGRSKPLRADGAPKDLRVRVVEALEE